MHVRGDAKERPKATLDDFDCEILRGYFLATVDEMVGTTVRAAYSTAFSEGRDFSCALFDSAGRMYAQEGGCAVHLGGLFDVVQEMTRVYSQIEPGDVFIHNDPLAGGSHQADISVAVPIFHNDGFLGMAVNRGHWVDVGGMAAGGYSGGATHILQEGLRLPALRLFRNGVLNDEVRRFLLANIRQPRESWGDLEAQIASCMAAKTRVLEAVERHGVEGFSEAVEYVQNYTGRRLRAAIREIAEGVYLGREEVEDDGVGGGPFHVTARVTVERQRIAVDLSDASPQAAGPINGSWSCTKAAVYTALKVVLDPDMPLDSALLDVVSVVASEGTWIRPNYPAPMFAATAEPVNRVCEAVLRALAEAVPDRVIAATYGSGLNVTGTGRDPRDGSEFLWYHFGPGGCGARVGEDGNSATWHPMASCRNESLEVWEQRSPVLFDRFELLPDSGGRGEYRGGLGYRKEFTVLAETVVNVLQDRHLVGAPGLFGGEAGAPNAVLFFIDGTWNDARAHFGTSSPSKVSNVRIPAGAKIAVCAGGGGGCGDPSLRAREAVDRDLRYGYVTSKHSGSSGVMERPRQVAT